MNRPNAEEEEMSRSQDAELDVHHRLEKIEDRIALIEKHLGLAGTPLAPSAIPEEGDTLSSVEEESSDETIEYRIGFYWFAKFGIVILAIGFAFLLTFPYQNIPGYLPSLFGFVLSAGLLTASSLLRKSFDLVSRYFFGSAFVLLFFSVLRLHFFAPVPFVENRTVVVFLLCVIVAGNIFMSLQRSSPLLAALGLIGGYGAAIVSDAPYFIFLAITTLSGIAIYLKLARQWDFVLLLAIVMSYFTHLLWLINNPLVGNMLQLSRTHPINAGFVLIYLLVFALAVLYRNKGENERGIVAVTSFLNCSMGFGVFVLSSEAALENYAALACAWASIVFLLISIWFWVKEKSKYSTFFYSMTGYLVLSVAILLFSHIPDVFVWLSWQSVIVLVTAILFRSRFIVVTNFVFYILLLLSYLASASAVGAISLSFGIIALLSARILNVQQHRLEIKTDTIRYTYLGAAFVAFPYALFYTVPEGYIPLSWMGVALFYYVMHRILRNQRYQLMSLLTLILTVLYVAFVGIVKLDPALRIVSLLALGVVLLTISIVYAKVKRNQKVSEG